MMCEIQYEYFGTIPIHKICSDGKCVRDEDTIFEKRGDLIQKKIELSDTVKGQLNKRQTLVDMQVQARKNCINALADVTSKFILESALKIGSPATALAELGADLSMDLVDQLTEDPESMKPEEFIAINCKLVESLESDIQLLDKQRQANVREVEKINDNLDKFP